MPFRAALAVVCLAFAVSAGGAEDRGLQPSSTPQNDSPDTQVSRLVVEAPNASLEVGDKAPTFSFLGVDGAWHESGEVFAHGAVLLVFGASRDELRAIEHERPRFEALHVTPAYVMDMRSSTAAAIAKRLPLQSPVITDPRRAIAGLYNSLDRATLRHAPGLFVVDEHGRIRSIVHGNLPPVAAIVDESARSLGREGAASNDSP